MVASSRVGVNQLRPYIGLLNDLTFPVQAMLGSDG